MSRRSLAILSAGMLSDSQKRSLTLLSEGWLAVALVPEPTDDGRVRRRVFAYAVFSGDVSGIVGKKKNDRVKKDDEEILAIIHTFMSWVV
jgi:hypothetical protein